MSLTPACEVFVIPKTGHVGDGIRSGDVDLIGPWEALQLCCSVKSLLQLVLPKTACGALR